MSQVRRRNPIVWAGPQTLAPLPELQDDEWHDLGDGGLVNTDDNGEGRIKIEDCGLIYVFQTSELITSACPKRVQPSGNVFCPLTGAHVFNNHCSGLVIIQALGAEIVLRGTWVAVFYLPEQQLSLVAVFDGAAQVRPIVNMDGPILGEAHDVPAGYFWFTSPGVRPEPVSDLAARVPHPFDRLGLVVKELDLGPWMEKIRERAREDKVPFPTLETPTPMPTLTETPTETPTPTLTPTPCVPRPPRNWTQYRVRRGDTLYGLARRHGTTVQQIRRVNCLVGSLIRAGQWLWLPWIPPTPTFTPTFTPTPTSTPRPAAVTGLVWLDYDEDGVRGIKTPEPVWPGIKVTITDGQGLPQTVQSNSYGIYSATVTPGRVTIDVDTTYYGEDYYYFKVTTDNDPTIVDIAAGSSHREDFGIMFDDRAPGGE